jgi:hypothetical protein
MSTIVHTYPERFTLEELVILTAPAILPTSGYAETFWLPIIGPTALWCARRLATRLQTAQLGVDLELLAVELGVGRGVGRNSPICRTLNRLVAFDMARFDPDRAVYAVRLHWPILSERHARRLPPHLAVAARPPEPAVAAVG